MKNEYLQDLMLRIAERDPAQPEFLQAVHEVLESLEPVMEARPEFIRESVMDCMVEPELMDAKAYDSFQFVRNGFFCVDCKDSTEGHPVYNRIVGLKSSFKLPAQA